MQRLRRKTEVDQVFRAGRRFYAPWVMVQARCRQPEEPVAPGPRVAVTTSRGFRGSVERNRARRLLREACRVVLGEGAGLWDLVLVARPEVLSIPFAERVRILSSLLREAGACSQQTPLRQVE